MKTDYLEEGIIYEKITFNGVVLNNVKFEKVEDNYYLILLDGDIMIGSATIIGKVSYINKEVK